MVKEMMICASARRKTSVACAYLKSSKGGTGGNIVVNGQPLDEYFRRVTSRMIVRKPLVDSASESSFDFTVTVKGGGSNGQAGAIRNAIARALLKHDADLKKVLRAGGHLTIDSRRVERKKVGRKGARKRPQFSKR